MTSLDRAALDAALETLPQIWRGPGGVAGVLHEGRVLAARSWGYADLDSRQPMTAATRLPLCSISKQFTCAALLAACGAPEGLQPRLAARLPAYRDELPKVRDLCNNQSGLRDYWALTVLQGAKAEQEFRREDAGLLLARMKTGHFAPGTRYSYSNCNFRLLADLMEEATGLPLAELYARHVFGPAGMAGAVLAPDTRRRLDGVVGYEGNDATGYLPAENGIYWMGDAGISASLDDMLAYESWIDATRDDPQSLYRRIAEPQGFRDGTPARYGFGLNRTEVAGHVFTGHGGALRGFRAHRINCRAARLSVVVLLNHEADAHSAAFALAKAALGLRDAAASPLRGDWGGVWISPETGLLARLEPQRDTVLLRYATSPESLPETAEGELATPAVQITREGEALRMRRPQENFDDLLLPVAPGRGQAAALAGRYHSEELDADMVIETRDGAAHVWFGGMLGQGRVELLQPVTPDHWVVMTRRSMDAPAPGDWTLSLVRDAAGAVTGARLGCWLAREIDYRKTV